MIAPTPSSGGTSRPPYDRVSRGGCCDVSEQMTLAPVHAARSARWLRLPARAGRELVEFVHESG